VDGKRISDQIRTLRKRQGLTLQTLAERTQLTKGYLSRIERAHQAPPVFTLQKIAQALGMDIGDFFEEPVNRSTPSANLDICCREDLNYQEARKSYSSYLYLPLIHNFKNKYMWPVLVRVHRGQTESFSHDSEEFVYVLEGELLFHYEGQVHALGKGDSFYFDSRIKHAFENTRDDDAVLLGVNFNYRRF
jgi:transcriptional regulator with XRE-family HTH domain